MGSLTDEELFEEICLDLNIIRNDFIFLHVNCFGESFSTSHSLSETFYTKLQDNIDVALEIYAGLFGYGSSLAVPFSLNDSDGSYIEDNGSFEEKLQAKNPLVLFEIMKELCQLVADDLEILREIVEDSGLSGYASQLDGILEFWDTQANFIMPRYLNNMDIETI